MISPAVGRSDHNRCGCAGQCDISPSGVLSAPLPFIGRGGPVNASSPYATIEHQHKGGHYHFGTCDGAQDEPHPPTTSTDTASPLAIGSLT
eukprot:2257306-Pyramimonas_sp.AAC.2